MCPFERLDRQQRRAILRLLQVLQNYAGFVDEPLRDAQHRYFCARANGEGFRALAGEKWHLLERQALFQQRQLDHVVVVADRKSVKLEHHIASRPCRVGSTRYSAMTWIWPAASLP
ncbi:hypothetical protein D3C81_1918380 [compost metagenome]